MQKVEGDVVHVMMKKMGVKSRQREEREGAKQVYADSEGRVVAR
jgi:hypothetical protein